MNLNAHSKDYKLLETNPCPVNPSPERDPAIGWVRPTEPCESMERFFRPMDMQGIGTGDPPIRVRYCNGCGCAHPKDLLHLVTLRWDWWIQSTSRENLYFIEGAPNAEGIYREALLDQGIKEKALDKIQNMYSEALTERPFLKLYVEHAAQTGVELAEEFAAESKRNHNYLLKTLEIYYAKRLTENGSG